MMHEKIENSNQKLIKGSTKIELFNKNGELEYSHEEENMFSPYWLKYFNLCNLSGVYKDNNGIGGGSFIKYLSLYNSDETEDEILKHQLGGKGVDINAIANLHTVYSGSDVKYGTINLSKTKYSTLDFKNAKSKIQYVCDFNAGVGTGTFNTVSLMSGENKLHVTNRYTSIDGLSNIKMGDSSAYTQAIKGDVIVHQTNSYVYTAQDFYVTDKDYNIIRMVKPSYPTSSTATTSTILDLEPENDNVVYFQACEANTTSGGKVYKWNLLTDEFEEFTTFSKNIKKAFKGIKDGKEVTFLLESARNGEALYCPQIFLYDSEQKQVGDVVGRFTTVAGSYSSSYSENYISNIFSFKTKDDTYVYVLTNSLRYYVFSDINDLFNVEKVNKYYISCYATHFRCCYNMSYNKETDSIVALARYHSSTNSVPTNLSTAYLIHIANPIVTINKLAEPITKTEEQALRITYTLEMDM